MKGFKLLDYIIKELKSGGVLCCNVQGYQYIYNLFTSHKELFVDKHQYKFFNESLEESKRIIKEYAGLKFSYLAIYIHNDTKKYTYEIGNNIDTGNFKKIFYKKENGIVIKIYKIYK